MNKKLYVRDMAIVILLTASINIFFFIWITIDAFNSGDVVSLETILGTMLLTQIALGGVLQLFYMIAIPLGFWIVGCLSGKDVKERLFYLGYVGIGIWLLELIYVALKLTSMAQWLFSIVPIFIFIILGGGLSLLTCKTKK
ncbi:MAG: hypothetical protein P8Y43_03320 [Sulfurovaceae bacterium]|jgi:hypothetical protein